jgi:hypothetical protein
MTAFSYFGSARISSKLGEEREEKLLVFKWRIVKKSFSTYTAAEPGLPDFSRYNIPKL